MNEGAADTSPVGHRNILFWICALAIFTIALSFSLRTGVAGGMQRAVFDPIDPSSSGRMIGDALGAAFLGFAISLLVASPLIDTFGAKKVLLFACFCHVAGPLLIILAPEAGDSNLTITLIRWGMILSGLGWGATEASTNPLVAALYPDERTHRLNMLHAWWPAGIVVGGLTVLGLRTWLEALDWRVAIAIIPLPAIILGLWTLTQKFPPTESRAMGVSLPDMLLEPFRKPSFWIFAAIMLLTASAELAPASWVDVALTQTVGMQGIWVLIYVSALMFVMRHFAGALAHRFSDIGLLCIAMVPASIGLYLLSISNSPVTALVAASAWAMGIAFSWPTMLAAVSLRYPRGGPWAIGLLGFSAAMAIQFILPKLGRIYDEAKLDRAGGAEGFAQLDPAQLAEVLGYAAERSFQAIAVIPVALFFIFGALWLVERKGRLGSKI